MVTRLLPLTFLTLCLAFQLTAQSGAVSDKYERNGLAVMYVNYQDTYETAVRNAYNGLVIDAKFDKTVLPVNYINARYSRSGTEENVRRKNVTTAMARQDYGKDILCYLFNRKPTGMMDIERVAERGAYNATDVEVMKFESMKRGIVALGDRGFDLIANNYILVTDVRDIKEEKDNEGKTKWTAKTDGYLYQIKYDNVLQEAFFQCWIYDSDSQEEIARKKAAFDKLSIGMKLVGTGSTSHEVTQEKDKYNKQAAINQIVNSSHRTLIIYYENMLDSWSVRSAITSTRPVQAKIGTKEGLRNTKRFDVYEYYARDNGDIYSKRKGIVRATKVARNTQVADRNMPSSEFYQIAGGRLEPGMMLKQNNDVGMGLGLAYRMNAKSGYFLMMDYLLSIRTSGISHYGLIEIGYDNHKISGSPDWGTSAYSQSKRAEILDVGFGYGLGIRPVRQFEIVPHVLVGIEGFLMDTDEEKVNGKSEDENGRDDKFWDKAAVYFTFGMKFNITVAYPVQIFGGADYNLYVDGGHLYKDVRNMLESVDKKRKGVGFHAGLRFIF